jgi:hypothetical protein
MRTMGFKGVVLCYDLMRVYMLLNTSVIGVDLIGGSSV